VKNKKILIIGGSGSLGHRLIERYIDDNEIYCMSRDETKHWNMSFYFNKLPQFNNLKFVIGDIRNSSKIKTVLRRIKPDVIVLAAAMKHIDKCELEPDECIGVNLFGTQVVLDEIENNLRYLKNLESVCFTSTDKACNPVSTYGMCKAVSENLMVEKSIHIPQVKFVSVRYGNILNSNGSIIPTLHTLGKDKNIGQFKLTNENMTRFIMTLDNSVDLIEHAILRADSGDVVIPKLVSCKIKDVLNIFSDLYEKPIAIGSIRPGEKITESLINTTQSIRTTKIDDYMHIKPVYKNYTNDGEMKEYTSELNCISSNQLHDLLSELQLI